MSVDWFRNSICALAFPADIQILLFPDFTCKGDELVLEFDKNYRESDLSQLNSCGRDALEKLDKYLENHSGEGFESMYLSDHALKTDTRWDKIRDLSRCVLNTCGWEYTTPRKPESIYIKNRAEG